ncbi:hypothetical protein PVIIG_06227 [Plasmodium vivax India VII]|uniref:VIR protein n=1 Tax=Plasmodium vivax India VII TaxID=1077284 RepID=A0A0J9S2S9_PLAVI|nr:hypothetical protein PVIIG_06227 [Plasmodium vivax India VII]
MSCEYNYNDFEEKDALKDLCAKFKCFYSLLFDPDGVKAYSDNENVEYLNYWLNNEFKNKKISSISASNFYQKFIFYDILFDTENRLRDKIYKIKEEHLKQMDILYDLNTIYNNIKSNLYYDKQKCIDYSKDCVHKYKEAIKPCSINKNTKYCDALMAFKIKYENIESMNLFGGDNTECVLPLPTLVEEKLHRAIVAEPEVATSEAKQLPEERENNNDNNNSIFTIFDEKKNFGYLIVDLDDIKKSQLVAMNFYKILTQDYFYRFFFSTFILLGIFLIFYLFYKLTPVGYKLNKKASKKKQKNYHNNGGNRKELFIKNNNHIILI